MVSCKDVRPPITITGTDGAVAPGRQLSIVCSSIGNFGGKVEWTRLNGSGRLRIVKLYLSPLAFLNFPAISNAKNDDDCDLVGILFTEQNENFSEVLKTGRFGFRSSASGTYVCTATNKNGVSKDQITLSILGLT